MDMGLFLVVLFIVAALWRVDFFFYIFYAVFAVYLFSRLWVGYALPRVRVERHMEERSFWGERQRVTVRVVNEGLLPLPWLRLQERLPQPLAFPPVSTMAVSLMPKEATEFSYELDCRRRGLYEIGPTRVSTGDLLGAMPEVWTEHGVSRLVVYPRLVPMEDFVQPSRSPFGGLKRPAAPHRDPTRVGGVRPYQVGDSWRHIHWRASAASGGLQTKNFDPVISLDTAIIVDLERTRYEPAHAITTTELAISAAATAAQNLTRRRQPFSLTCNGRDPLAEEGEAPVVLRLHSGQAHLMLALELLGRVQTQARETLEELLDREAVRLPWGCAVLIVTGNGAKLAPRMMRLCRGGHPVVVALVDYHSNLEEAGQELEAAGAQVWRLRQSTALARWAL